MSTHSTVELLQLWDRRRPRSLQRSIGMSDIGGCQRRAKYRRTGTEPTDSGSSVQAILGTLIHEKIAEVLTELQEAGLIPADDLIEHKTAFGGIEGSPDHYEAATYTVVNTKTTSGRNLDRMIAGDIPDYYRLPDALYAASLLKKGHEVRWLRLDVIARDTGEEHQFVRRFDMAEVHEAMTWLNTVDTTPLEQLPRRWHHDSAFCSHCPFRTACWGSAVAGRAVGSARFVDRPDLAHWVDELVQARRAERDAKDRAKAAREALDAIRPNEAGKATVEIPGVVDKALSWSVTERSSLDRAAIEADYAARGEAVPMKTTSSVTVNVVKNRAPAALLAQMRGERESA